MSEWWTYSLSDFLLFSPRTYYRLFELYNRAIWPAQLVELALGAAILGLLRVRAAWQGRAVATLLAACWAFVAWAFLLERYSTINWAASYFAVAFLLEALLLLWRVACRASRFGLGPTSWAAPGSRSSYSRLCFSLWLGCCWAVHGPRSRFSGSRLTQL